MVHPHRRIVSKLLAYQLPLVTLAMVLVFGLLEYGFYRTQVQALQTQLETLLRGQESGLSGALWEVNDEQVQQIVNAIAADPNVEYVVVSDEQGRIKAQAGDAQRAEESPLQGQRRLAQQATAVGELRVTLHTRAVLAQVAEHMPRNAAVLAAVLLALMAESVRLKLSQRPTRV